MFRYDLDHLKILDGHTLVTHLACHTHAFEYLRGIRTSTDRTRFTRTVMLTVSALTHTTETMAFYYTLETFTFRRSNNIYETSVLQKVDGKHIA